MGSSELAVVGLTCNLVGVFFLANSIIFRRPRRVLEEFFGVGRGSLAAVRDYELNKMQVVIGFLFLNCGFLLLALSYLDTLDRRWLTMLVSLCIVAFAGFVYAIGAIATRRSFQRYLREFFQRQPWSFHENMTLTKEIGQILGIHHTKDMTVEDYVRKVKQALGVPPPSEATGSERTRRIRDISPLTNR